MVRADQLAIFPEQETIGRPVKGTTLVRAGIEVGPDTITDPEQRDIPVRTWCLQQYFLSGFRINIL